MTASQHDTPRNSPGLLEALWRFWWIPLLLGLIGYLAGGIFAGTIDEEYEASTRLTVKSYVPVDQDTNPAIIRPERHIANEVEAMRSTNVRTIASAALGDDPTPENLGSFYTIASTDTSNQLEITATADTPERAAEIVDAVVAAYQFNSVGRINAAAERSIAQLTTQETEKNAEIAAAAAAVEARRAELRAAATGADGVLVVSEFDRNVRDDVLITSNENLSIRTTQALAAITTRRTELRAHVADWDGYVEGAVDPATASSDPIGLSPNLLKLLGLVGGFGAGAIGAWWLAEQLPKAEDVRSVDIARDVGAPLLVELTGLKDSSNVVVQRSSSGNAAAYDDVLFTLLHRIPGGVRSTIAVVGPEDAPRPSIAANLAIAASRKGMAVVLVDTDVSARTLTAAAGATDSAGLINLADAVDVGSCITMWPDSKYELDFVGIGSGRAGGASHFFRAGGLSKALDALAQHYDIIILNGPALPGSGHAQAVAKEAAYTVVAVDSGDDQEDLEALQQRLTLLEGTVAGVVVSKQVRPWWYPASLDTLVKRLPLPGK
jgi:capsular polysaccharide biosynthesis protein/Mrp family chromosome partitioning ATPase